MKKCKYRNCDDFISNGRIDKQYCTVQCKKKKKKYRQRMRKKLNNEKV